MQTIDQTKAINNMVRAIQLKQYNQQYGQSDQSDAIKDTARAI